MILDTIVTGPLQENCFIVADEASHSGFVIDPGWDSENIKFHLDSRGITDVTILLTHGHFDHVSGTAELVELTGAKVYMSSLDEFLMESVGGSTSMMMGMGDADKFKIDSDIHDGDIFTAGEIKLTAMHTPGHTPGGMSFYDGGKHVFVGDCLFRDSVGRVDFPRSNGPDLINSIINVLYKLPDGTIVHTGHGSDTTIGYEKKHNPFTNHPEWLLG